jgi:hypothetical protein
MAKTWVVYRRPIKDDPIGLVGVCTDAEWVAMDREAPGVLILVRAGLPTEGEAERVARAEASARPPQGPAAKAPPRAAKPTTDDTDE